MKNVLISVLVFASIVTAGCSSAPLPEQVTKTYIQGMATGDVEAVFNVLDLTNTRLSYERQQLQQKMANNTMTIAQKGGVSNIVYGIPEYSGKNQVFASVPAIITYSNGETTNARIRLKETRKGWKVR